jgi:hypothetical protein
VPTSKRPQVDDIQYPRIPRRILKGASNDYIVAGVAMSGAVADETMKSVDLERIECRDTQISCIAVESLSEPLEACRPQEGLKCIAPKHLEALGRAIRRASHREAFIPDAKSLGVQSVLAGLQEHTDLGRSCIHGAQLGWQSRSHTEVLQDLGIKAR